MKTQHTKNYDQTLARVRSLSENPVNKPEGRKLFCASTVKSVLKRSERISSVVCEIQQHMEGGVNLNPCQCGSKAARVQDYGDIVFVKCPDCGNKNPVVDRHGQGDKVATTVADWNMANPIQEERPTSATVNGEGFLRWCDRQQQGEVNISNVEVLGNAKYRLTMWWPTLTNLQASNRIGT